jgi:serine protease AprX
VTSGAVALLLSARPTLKPDQVKAIIMGAADGAKITPKSPKYSGKGLLRVDRANVAALSNVAQTWPASTGTGSLDAARGGTFVTVNGSVLKGEITVNGAAWPGARWTGARWTAGTWDGARWTGGTWLGARWTGARWTGARWTGASWTGARWTGARWTDAAWSSSSWLGARWTGARWTDASWDGARWTTAGWT